MFFRAFRNLNCHKLPQFERLTLQNCRNIYTAKHFSRFASDPYGEHQKFKTRNLSENLLHISDNSMEQFTPFPDVSTAAQRIKTIKTPTHHNGENAVQTS
jgi:hypothetical protein